MRLDRGLSQSEVARLLDVTTDTVTGWELNRHEPTVQISKRIIEFLGYVPCLSNESSLCRRLHLARMVTGKTQEEVAEKIGVYESTLRWIELGKRMSFCKTREKIEAFVEEALPRRLLQ